MNRCSFCEWIPILPGPVWPLAGHARLWQNTVVGSMTILLSWLCLGACQEEVCLDPRFLCNLTLPRFSVELPWLFGRPFYLTIPPSIVQRAREYFQSAYAEASRPRQKGSRTPKGTTTHRVTFCPQEGNHQASSGKG